jgi:hypothetical protein
MWSSLSIARTEEVLCEAWWLEKSIVDGRWSIVVKENIEVWGFVGRKVHSRTDELSL